MKPKCSKTHHLRTSSQLEVFSGVITQPDGRQKDPGELALTYLPALEIDDNSRGMKKKKEKRLKQTHECDEESKAGLVIF